MDPMNKSRMEELVQLKLDGRSYSEIRADLKKEGLDQETIAHMIRQVDEQVLKQTMEGSKPDRTRQVYFTGLGLALAGLLIAVVFNIGLILEEWPALLVYSPFLAGILLMLASKRMHGKRNKKTSGSGAIRRQRPYK